MPHRWRLLPTRANGQLAFGAYRWDDAEHAFLGEGVDVLTLRDGGIAAITAFLASDLEAYGLPPKIFS
jgi:RNA polymerase sigma-70 factor (ECF subfamily)